MAHVALIRVTRRKSNVRQRCGSSPDKSGSMVKPPDRGEGLGGNANRLEKLALELTAALIEPRGSHIDSEGAVGCFDQGNDVINAG